MARRPDDRPERGDPPTTGHEWDGIRELDTPLPRWWLWVFYATIVWAIGYWIVMPSWPLGDWAGKRDYFQGLLGYSQRAALDRSLERAKAAQAGYVARIRALPLADIEKDRGLFEFALAGGRSAFQVNCSQCHGTGAAGSKGFPNLNDDDWLWGGKLNDIYTTIRHGINAADEDTRVSQMPAFLKDEILNRQQVEDVAAYVLSLTGRAKDAAAVARGKALFAENCASCHGPDGHGNREFGAPNLADAIWLYGGDRQTVIETIANSRRGVMPAWQGKLAPETIKMLALYVHSLGGGER